jgi:hypothetical protein
MTHRTVFLTSLILLAMMVGCGTRNPSALVGKWSLDGGQPADGMIEGMELLKNGTGIIDGENVTWRTEGGRFYVIQRNQGRIWDYKISDSMLTLTGQDGQRITYKKVDAGTQPTSQDRMQCADNLKQIMLAMHMYHDSIGKFPASYTVDHDGRPMHSWRVALLPYLGQAALFEEMCANQYWNEPWDSEKNKRFHNVMIPVYQCPAAKNLPGITNYSLVVGKVDEEQANELGLTTQPSFGTHLGTAFPEPNKWNSMSIVVDGTSNTIAIVERKEPVCWMDPTQEITFEKACAGINGSADGLGGDHKNGMNAGLFDGSTQLIENTIPASILRATLTCAGGESLSLP